MLTHRDLVLDDIRNLLGYVLDIDLQRDVDACRALSDETVARRLSRLVPRRFAPAREISRSDANAGVEVFESLVESPEPHLLLVRRATGAYESGMSALAADQRDLAYSLLAFGLECLAQTRPTPANIRWEDYPPGQRNRLDKVLKPPHVSREAADEVREILTSTRHLGVAANFREFVLESLHAGFFAATTEAGQLPVPVDRLRRSLMPRLLDRAYDTRSGFAHALAPIGEDISAEADREFCELRTGDLCLTFQGLHRVVRGVMSTVLARRSAPGEGVPPPDTPGVVRRRWSYEYWLYDERPRPDGADARGWIVDVLHLHIAFCVLESSRPPRPVPVKEIGAVAASGTPDARRRSAMDALAWICGHPPSQQPRRTIETLVAEVFTSGACGPDLQAAERALRKHLRAGTENFRLPRLVEIAVIVAVARGALEGGDAESARYWLEVARDDAGCDASLQRRLRDAATSGDAEAIDPNQLLFPNGSPGQLLKGFAE